MFVYCLNNPVNMEDSDGEFAFALLAIPAAIKLAIGIGAVIGAIYTGYTIGAYARHEVQKSNIKFKSNSKSKSKSKKEDKPKNYTPPGAGRRGAGRAAKRNSGIPVSQQPIKTKPATDKRGKRIPGRDYDYGNGRVIRDHSGGHTYQDDPSQNRGPHFNDVHGNHYDYK